jgi:succinoglycan biosynthesis protein ExoA
VNERDVVLTALPQPVDSGQRASVDVQLSVVIPCRNEAPYVAGMLDALRAQDSAIDEVIIVDGGSVDGTMEVVRKYGARHPDFPLRVVTAYGANIPAAVNAGIAASRSDVIVRMDSHSRPAADYIRRVLQALDETDAAVVGGIWQISPGAPGPVAAAIASAVAHPMGAGDAAYRLSAGRQHERRRVDTVPFGGFRRSHWRQVGGYNEQLLVNEDYEFNYRTRQAGGSVVLDTAIRCEYFARPSLAALARQYFRYGWWKGRMLRQHPRSIRLRQAVPALFLPVWLALGVSAALAPIVRPVVAALLAAYVVVLIAAATHAAARRWRLVIPIAAAFFTIHSAWSAGISSFFLTGASALARRQPGGRRPRAGLTGVQLGVALSVIFLLSVVLPWSMASRLHRGRVDRARREVGAIAAALQAAGAARQAGYQPDAILVGPGANPQVPQGSDWRQVTAINASAAHLDLPLAPDPWGNHYLIYPSPAAQGATHGAGLARWVLSAGPNGIVDTPFRQAPQGAALGGDDIGVRLD